MIKEMNLDLYSTVNTNTFAVYKYLGSMFLLDAGEKIIRFNPRRKQEYITGEITISVRECFWDIFYLDTKILSCHEELNNEKMHFLLNKFIQKFSIEDSHFIIHLSDGINIVCDLTNQAELEDYDEEHDAVIAIYFLNSNKVYEIGKYGNISLVNSNMN